MHFAAALQAATDAAVIALLRRSVKLDRLCVSGASRSIASTNELIRRASAFSNIFIPSAVVRRNKPPELHRSRFPRHAAR
jgi:predicted NodU family carbamoyl transferase